MLRQMGSAYTDPFARLDRIIAAHRVYMQRLGHFEEQRHYRGINFPELNIVRFLAARVSPPPVSFVADRLRIHHTHASHLLASLEKQGFVAGMRDSRDGRCRLYDATPQGKSLAEAFEDHIRDKVARIVLSWPLGKQAEVAGLLERLAGALRDT